jgi:hypothetical protein
MPLLIRKELPRDLVEGFVYYTEPRANSINTKLYLENEMNIGYGYGITFSVAGLCTIPGDKFNCRGVFSGEARIPAYEFTSSFLGNKKTMIELLPYG